MRRLPRRRVLIAAVTSGTAALAGCSDSETDTGADESDVDTEAADDTDGSSTEDTEEGDDAGSEGEGPAEEVLRAFLQALFDGDTDRQAELLHPESPLDPEAETYRTESDLTEIAAVTVEEAAENTTVRDVGELEFTAVLETSVDEINGDEYTIVMAVFEGENIAGGRDEQYVVLVPTDDSWRIYTTTSREVSERVEERDRLEQHGRDGPPEEIVEVYYGVLSDGDADTADILIHPESDELEVSQEDLTPFLDPDNTVEVVEVHRVEELEPVEFDRRAVVEITRRIIVGDQQQEDRVEVFLRKYGTEWQLYNIEN